MSQAKDLRPDPAGFHDANPATQPQQDHAAGPRRPSRFLLRFFDLYLSLYVPFHFGALRMAAPERFPLTARPLIVCINHPSWWDPLTSILLSRFLLRTADHYAPIDDRSLTRYGILGGLGLFPVEQGTARGAVQFLRAARRILSDPNSLLWLTPQGGFTDVRSRPLVFKPGLASLIKRLDQVTVVPLAYEYTYWDRRLPEILTLCGQPVTFTRGQLDGGSLSGESGITAALTGALAATQDELAVLAASRNPAHFHTVLGGQPEGSGLAGAWRNLAGALRAGAGPPSTIATGTVSGASLTHGPATREASPSPAPGARRTAP
ncbi:MAG TPA: lysophospholipid acyltransferase family protein [Acidobacteriaceae bacterium]